MHPYATDSPERRQIPLALAVVSVVLALALSRLPWHAPWWLDAPSVVAFYGALYALFDRVLWRTTLLRKLGVVRVPNLAGNWEGEVHSARDGDTSRHSISLLVTQTWTCLSVVVRTGYSRSRSLVAALHIDDDPDGPCLVYEYLNKPEPAAVESMHMHHGTAHLIYDAKDQSLSGEYYTGRDRQTYGGLRVVRQRKDENQPQEQS